jgi:hypothetical protein
MLQLDRHKHGTGVFCNVVERLLHDPEKRGFDLLRRPLFWFVTANAFSMASAVDSRSLMESSSLDRSAATAPGAFRQRPAIHPPCASIQ